MISKLRRVSHRVLGAVTIATVAAVGGGLLALPKLHLGDQVVVAHFSQTAGLHAGESVDVAGIEVGRVTGIDLGGNDVVVTMALGHHVPLGDTTTASIDVATLLGTHVVTIAPAGSGTLKDNTIQLAHTTVPFNLQDVLDTGGNALSGLDSSAVSSALNALSSTFDHTGPQIGPALAGISAMADLITTRGAEAGKLLNAATDVANRLSANSADVITLMKVTSSLFEALLAQRGAVEHLLARTRSLATKVSRLVSDNQPTFADALGQLQVVLHGLNAQDAQLSQAISLLGPSARYYANSTGDGPWFDAAPQTAVPDAIACKQNRTCGK